MIRRVLAVALMALPTTPSSSPYRDEVEAWRRQREANLKADGGWLTVAGLFWLKEGPNRFGSDATSDIVLPPSVSPRAGVFTHEAGVTRFALETGVEGTIGGARVESGVLHPDTSPEANVLSLGRVTLQVIERGGRFGIRMKDLDSEHRKGFPGLKWYPVAEGYRLSARFVPSPKKVAITNVLGQVSDLDSPGHLVFTLNGQELTLDPVLETPDATELFIMFRDGTTLKETYGAGRFLYTDMPKDGVVVLDFNKAYSPPCAFTAYATCPLPPKQNVLPVRVEAGELRPEASH